MNVESYLGIFYLWGVTFWGWSSSAFLPVPVSNVCCKRNLNFVSGFFLVFLNYGPFLLSQSCAPISCRASPEHVLLSVAVQAQSMCSYQLPCEPRACAPISCCAGPERLPVAALKTFKAKSSSDWIQIHKLFITPCSTS